MLGRPGKPAKEASREDSEHQCHGLTIKNPSAIMTHVPLFKNGEAGGRRTDVAT